MGAERQQFFGVAVRERHLMNELDEWDFGRAQDSKYKDLKLKIIMYLSTMQIKIKAQKKNGRQTSSKNRNIAAL